MLSTRTFLLALSALLLLAACQAEPDEPRAEVDIPFDREGTLDFLRGERAPVTIDIEIAETDSARERGLMQRRSLPPRSGMLFLFEREEPQRFWMANTPLALDIIFVDADSQIVSIAKYTKPFSPEGVASGVPARYVVEVPAGFADTHGIIEGTRVRWRRTDGE